MVTFEQTLRQLKRARFWREHWIINFLAAGLFLSLTNWLYLLLSLKEKMKVIPLHSSFLFGVERIGSKIFLLELPSVGLIIYLVNFFLAFLLYERGKKTATQFLLLSSVFLQIVLFVGTILIIKL